MIVYSEGNTITHVTTREVGVALLHVASRHPHGWGCVRPVEYEARNRRRLDGTRVTINVTVVHDHLNELVRAGYATKCPRNARYTPTAKLDSLVNSP